MSLEWLSIFDFFVSLAVSGLDTQPSTIPYAPPSTVSLQTAFKSPLGPATPPAWDTRNSLSFCSGMQVSVGPDSSGQSRKSSLRASSGFRWLQALCFLNKRAEEPRLWEEASGQGHGLEARSEARPALRPTLYSP